MKLTWTAGSLLLISIVIFFANSWGFSIYIIDEARNAECAREMLTNGEWIVPTYNGDLRFDKPPLHYWFMMLGYQLFGVNPFGARFFSGIMGILTVMTTFFFTKRLLNERVAFFSGLTLLSSLQIALQFHLAVPDPFLIFFVTLGLFSFISGLETNHKGHIFLIYIALGFAVLSKGPVAIALPGLVFLLYLIFTKQLSIPVLLRLQVPLGSLLFLIIALPWYIMVGLKTDGLWLQEFFFNHNVGRFTSTMEGHGGSFIIIPIIVLAGLLPLSLFLIQGTIKAWKERSTNPLLLFALLVMGVFVVFFSMSQTKLPTYPEPCYPFVSILIGYYVVYFLQKGKSKTDSIILWSYTSIMVILPIGLYIGLGQDPVLKDIKHLSVYFSVLSISAIIALSNYYKGYKTLSIYSMVAGFLLLSQVATYVVLPAMDQQTPVVDGLAKLDTTRTFAYYGRMNQALPFNLQKTLPKLETKEELSNYFAQHPEGYLISEKRNAKSLMEVFPDLELIYEKIDPFERKTMMVFIVSKDTSL
ncbi:glycosyltransferase family 39 protein [Algivirga pacifica]|uniref:Glycosyltransferase family 39 protein n=1 Tax=Algivirga pacifica TaxID=1162670 RepID=A0ABP9D5T8_9BACT